ncbi:unnamed protein product, partial [Symbiodinium sp. KB8]
MAGLLTKEGGTELDGTEGSGSSGSGQEGPRDAPPGAMSGFEEDMDIGCDDGFGDGDDGDDGEGFGFDMGAGDGYDAFDTGVDEGGGFEGFGGSGEGSQAADPAAHAVDVLLRENLGDARGRGALGDSDTAWFGPDVVGSMEEWRRFGWSRGGAGGAGSSSNGKRSKRKEPFMIDFSAPPVPVDRLAPPPRNPKSTHLSDAAITKALSVGEAKFTLPPDTEYEVRRTAQCHTTGAIPLFACGYAFAVLIRLPQPTSLLELFLRPQRLVFRGTKETVEQTGRMYEAVDGAAGINFNAPLGSDGFMMDDGGDDGDGGVDDYGVDMEGFEGPDGAGNLEYGDMVEAARKVDKIDVQYAKKAKK